MIRGITSYYFRVPRFILRIIHFIPILLTALYLILIAAIVLPLAVAICLVLVPLLYVLWRAKENRFNPTFLRIMYPFELIGLTIVNAPQIVSAIAARTAKFKKPTFPSWKLNPPHMNRSKSMMIAIKALAIIGLIGVAAYLVIVAAVVVPLAMALCILATPFCYLAWYVKEKKFIPLFQKIPAALEQLGFNIVNSRKIMTNLMVGLKAFKWPMF